MSDFYLDYGSIDEICNELLSLRQENENLRNRIIELEDEIRECYESIEIDKMPDSDYLYDDRDEENNDYNDGELDDIEYSLYGYESEFSNSI